MRGREENGWRIEKKDAHKGDETKEERSRGGGGVGMRWLPRDCI